MTEGEIQYLGRHK